MANTSALAIGLLIAAAPFVSAQASHRRTRRVPFKRPEGRGHVGSVHS